MLREESSPRPPRLGPVCASPALLRDVPQCNSSFFPFWGGREESTPLLVLFCFFFPPKEGNGTAPLAPLPHLPKSFPLPPPPVLLRCPSTAPTLPNVCALPTIETLTACSPSTSFSSPCPGLQWTKAKRGGCGVEDTGCPQDPFPEENVTGYGVTVGAAEG